MNKKFLELKNVEGLNQKDFSELIENLCSDIKTIKISWKDASQVWNNIYSSVFDRSFEYRDDDIVNLHMKFNKLFNDYKESLKEYQEPIIIEKVAEHKKNEDGKIIIDITNEGIGKGIYNLDIKKEVPRFQNLNDVYYYIVKNLMNKDCSLREFEFKLPHSTTYKCTSRTLLENKGRGVSTYKMYFDAKFSGDGEFREPSVYLIYTSRFIKSKDQIILKNVETIDYIK